MARQWLPIAILLLLGLGVFLFLNQGPGQQDGPPTIPTTEEEVLPEAADEAPEVAQIEELGPDTGTLERVTLDLPTNETPIQFGTPVEEGILVSVVDGESSEPLPTAQVIVLDTGVVDERELQAQLGSSPDFEALFLYLGVTYPTDDKGQVMIPEPVGDLVIAGRTDTHFNFAFDFDTDSGEVTLRLNPIRLLAVKVVDGNGLPVEGAPVSLRMRSGFFTQDLMRAESNREGIASLKLFDLLFTRLGNEDVLAALLVLTPNPVETPIDFNNLPEEPPVLVLPEAGQVEVHIVNAEGELQTEDYMVNLAIIDPNEVRSNSSGPDHWEEPLEHLAGRASNGKAYFPLVAFGQHLEVRVVSMDGERREVINGPGPVRGGKPVVFTLSPAVKHPILIGRVLNAEGMVGKNLNLDTRIKQKSQNGSSTHNASLRTDEEGRFRFLLDEEFEPGSTRSLTLIMKPTKRKPMRSVKIDLSRSFGPGEHDLGDLVVMIPPLVASGVVLNADGEPLRKAKVKPERKHYWGEDADNFYWSGYWELRTDTESDGSFKIHGEFEAGEYRLQVSHDDHSITTKEINLGSADVLIQMEAAVQVEGRVLLDDHVDRNGVSVYLVRPESEHSGVRSFHSELGKDGKFSFKGQEVGSASLRVESEFLDEVFIEFEDLELVAKGGMQEIPEIDLRGQLLSFKIKVIDEDGKKVEQVEIIGEDGQSRSGWRQNPISIVSAKPALTLEVGAQGYRSQKLTGLREDTEVTLGEGMKCIIQVSNMGAVPNGWTLHASMSRKTEADNSESPLSHTFHSSSYQNLPLDEFGKGEATVPAPGIYTIDFMISNDSAEDGSNTRWGVGGMSEFNTIEVMDIPGLQQFSVQIEESSLESTIQNALDND